VLLISALSAALYIYMFDVLTAQQDATLVNRARVVSGRTTWSHDTPDEIISPDVNYGEFGRSNQPSCFEIFSYDGTPLLRSQLLGTTDLPLPAMPDGEPAYANVIFPNGRPGRAVSLHFTPTHSSADALSPGMRTEVMAGREFTIVLAKDAGPVRNPTLVLLFSLIALVAIMAAGTIVLMSVALRRGLQPLQRISRQAANRSPDGSPELFPTDGMPGELLPICDRLNDLLGRLYEALQRQRRFTTDAAHELRTPIAEMRAVAEIASKWADLESARASLLDVLEVTRKMETIVNTLLALARCDYAKQALNLEPVEVDALIEKVWQNFRSIGEQRHVELRTKFGPDSTVQSDPAMLESILVNLFSNAAEYATAGSIITCKTTSNDSQLRLEIANDVEGVTSEDLPHFFEAFWRKDSSRSDDRHSGLGLTLTKAYADVLNGSLGVELSDADRVSFSLRLPLHESQRAAHNSSAQRNELRLPSVT
jgi:two-component system sensor histidine kinase QseC